ncbi:MAG TPA: 2,3,4,5-tetrahydropyridine-2,6-dicarboxylate N-succinyltransferase [Gammaproteobacteria bacterium]|nr:2,3,4,5-tetrahydropyridine-2,6-dicarboxylate N-succinyltransferase [Gammaproteobacteria bacterium]HQY22613.1 2,3,4,5-tetrahydropyridine-2,6-dicarboxylate N-succinyltransferase [Gammaproteobacteria bacterium]HQZ87313.1 2,3,4,5-tetrahydropyridine-2,6-dicarboxylate N-succinyltransferase [Gammaproteobacteria bacterium]HRA42605.1 2,3,4,5-tetrahydropyridine-2,6-dicarboxylate N-succinyltransferase [Gammaproteobacteria bacterium]
MSDLQKIIEAAYDSRSTLSPASADPLLREAIDHVLADLELGKCRVAHPLQPSLEKRTWQVNEWIKKAVLLYFCLNKSTSITGQFTQFYDKVPLRFTDTTSAEFEALGVRIVPPATVRRGAYIAPNTILMPSFVNIGAYIGKGTMVDTWVTVGSCAQIGNHVHLSGGVGIGGVLEPLQASPTIIEDNCFIGARSEIVEGVIVEHGSVISMGVYIGQSTRIYDRETGEIHYGRVPANSVVVPGNLPSSDGKYSLYCAVIVKRVDDKTRAKTSINELLRV